MPIEIETFGNRDTLETMKDSLSGEGVEVVVREEEKPGEGNEPEKPEEKKEKDAEAEDGKPPEKVAAKVEEKPEAKNKDEEKKGKDEEEGGWTKRLNKVIAQRDAEKERAEAAERKLAEKEKPAPVKAGSEKPPEFYSGKAKPKREDFAESEDPDAAFTEATARWAYAEEAAKDRYEQQQQEAIESKSDALAYFNSRRAETAKRHSDYDAVLKEASDVQISELMESVILRSEVGPDLMYYLAQHPDETAKIVALSGEDQLVRIGKLEARIEGEISAGKKADGDKPEEGEKKTGGAPPKKTESKAPEPPSRIKPGATPRQGALASATEDKYVPGVIEFSSEYERERSKTYR